MRKLGFLLTVGIAAALTSPANAASEAIKDMARSMHGPDDASHCDDTTSSIEKRVRFCVAAIKDGHFQYNSTLADLDRLTGKYDDALAALAEIEGRLPDLATSYKDEYWEPVLALRSEIYAQMGRFDEAKADSAELERIGLHEADAHDNQCRIRAIANRELEQGLAACNQAIDRKPRTSRFLTARGLIEFRLGRLQDALNDFSAALDHDGRFAVASYARGVVKSKLGDAAGAKDDMDYALKRDAAAAQEIAVYGLVP